jgi:hypothetical protein
MVAQIIITINEDQSMDVSGPLHDKEWCYLALDMAKDTIKNFRQEQKIITVPPDYVDKKIIKLKTI